MLDQVGMGESVQNIAVHLGRTPDAVSSRYNKLKKDTRGTS